MRRFRSRLTSAFFSASIALGIAVACQAGCATGSVDEVGGGGTPEEAGIGDVGARGDAHHDAPVPHDATSSDGNVPPQDSSMPPDMDSSMPQADSASPDDTGVDSPPPPVDAGIDSPPPPVDAGVDSPPPPHDAGIDSPPPFDAGVDSPPPFDAGQDSGVVSCNPVAQTGCPSGDKCTLNGAAPPALTCDPNGGVANGRLCDGQHPDDCAGPGHCHNLGSGPDVCRDFCNGDSDCKQPAVASGSTSEPNNVAHCGLDTLTGAGNVTYKFCTFACNPATAAGPSGCPAGLACAYGGVTTPVNIPELTDCEPPGTIAEGHDCSATNAVCAAGLVCVNNGTGSFCRQVCRNGNDNDCTIHSSYVCNSPNGVNSPMFGFCCSFFNGC